MAEPRCSSGEWPDGEAVTSHKSRFRDDSGADVAGDHAHRHESCILSRDVVVTLDF